MSDDAGLINQAAVGVEHQAPDAETSPPPVDDPAPPPAKKAAKS